MKKNVPNVRSYLSRTGGRLMLAAMVWLLPEPSYSNPLNETLHPAPPLSEVREAITVNGVVSSQEDGELLPGVNILVKGTTTGTVTDMDGAYSLTVQDENAVLIFSFIGFSNQEIASNGRSEIDVTMVPDYAALGEVVVIGYGTQRRSDLTGAVGSVGAAALIERPAPSLNQPFAGRVSGVQVNTNSGRPGGRTNIRIRGFSSINSSNNPLYVVDGVMLPMGNQEQASNAIDYINPNDIASVEVLKDASSTAIYGSRG